MSRTGTNSLTDALRLLGVSAVHFPATFADIEDHQAATDTRVADIFEQLDEVFRGSLFIFTERDVDSWLRSVERYWDGFRQFRATPGIRELHQRLYGSADFARDIYAAAYARHAARVAAYFRGRQNDLLWLNVVAGDGWGPLARFLGVAAPATPFPHNRAPAR